MRVQFVQCVQVFDCDEGVPSWRKQTCFSRLLLVVHQPTATALHRKRGCIALGVCDHSIAHHQRVASAIPLSKHSPPLTCLPYSSACAPPPSLCAVILTHTTDKIAVVCKHGRDASLLTEYSWPDPQGQSLLLALLPAALDLPNPKPAAAITL